MTPEKKSSIRKEVNKAKSKVAKNFFQVGLATSMILGAPACVPTETISTIPTGETNPLPGDSTKTAESPTEATYEVTSTPGIESTINLPTEVATEMPTATATEIPTSTEIPEATATVEAAPVNMDEVIDLTKLSPEQIAVVNEEMIKRIEQFKKGEICGDEVMKESGFFQQGDDEREAYLGVISGFDYSSDFQGCVLAGFIKNIKENDGRQFEKMYLIVGYEEKINRDRSVTLVQLDFERRFEANWRYSMGYMLTNSYNIEGNIIKKISSKDDLLTFWNKNLGNPVLIQLSFYEENITNDDREYLKSQGVDLVLYEENLKNYNLTVESNKDLALSSYCKTGNNPTINKLCAMETDNLPIEINSLSDAMIQMDGRPVPTFYRWYVLGVGP